MNSPLKIFCGNSKLALTKEICAFRRSSECRHGGESYGETFVWIDENIWGADVFIIQSTCNRRINTDGVVHHD